MKVPRALWLLMYLRLRGWTRSLVRSMKTVKGAITVILGLVILLPGMLIVFLAPDNVGRTDPDAIRRYAPVGLLGYCLLLSLFSSRERALYFSPGEVNFLFSGPFTPRQLLLFKIIGTSAIGLVSSLFITVFLLRHASWFLAAYFGLFFTLLFLQLMSMIINFIALTIGARAYSRVRKVILAVLLIGLAIVLFRSGFLQGGRVGMIQEMEQSPIWKVVSTPLGCLVETFLTPKGEWLHLLQYVGLSLGLNVVLLLIAMWMSTHYLETAASSSEKIYQQIQRARKGDWAWGKEGKKPRLALPMLPRWSGTGPILWQQMTTAMRSLHRLLIVCIAFIPAFVTLFFSNTPTLDATSSPVFIINTLFWLTMILSNLIPFDFRGEMDRMELLKTLPIRPWRVAVGEILTPVLIISVGQILLLFAIQAVTGLWNPWFVGYMVMIFPLSFLMFALDNLMFLLFPNRILAANPGDLQAVGRGTIQLLLKILVLGSVLGLTGVLSYLVYLLAGKVMLAGLITAMLLVSFAAIGLIPLLGLSFARFDMTQHQD